MSQETKQVCLLRHIETCKPARKHLTSQFHSRLCVVAPVDRRSCGKTFKPSNRCIQVRASEVLKRLCCSRRTSKDAKCKRRTLKDTFLLIGTHLLRSLRDWNRLTLDKNFNSSTVVRCDSFFTLVAKYLRHLICQQKTNFLCENARVL